MTAVRVTLTDALRDTLAKTGARTGENWPCTVCGNPLSRHDHYDFDTAAQEVVDCDLRRDSWYARDEHTGVMVRRLGADHQLVTVWTNGITTVGTIADLVDQVQRQIEYGEESDAAPILPVRVYIEQYGTLVDAGGVHVDQNRTYARGTTCVLVGRSAQRIAVGDFLNPVPSVAAVVGAVAS